MLEFSAEQLDALGEVVNIGVGRAAASLSELLGTRIELRVPRIRVAAKSLDREAGMAILQAFEGSVSGRAMLSFPAESGQKLARLLGGFEDDDYLPSIELTGILSEVGNIVLNGVLGSLSNIIESDLQYSVPDFFVDKSLEFLVKEAWDSKKRSGKTESTSILIADTHFVVQSENICGSVVIAFELGSLESLLDRLIKDQFAS